MGKPIFQTAAYTKLNLNMIPDLPTSATASLPPDPQGTAGIFQRVGYDLDAALADIIDNSLDAGASTILVRVYRAKEHLVRIVIADDGAGMSESKLARIMQYGVQEGHKNSDLGKYGIGLKSASFSVCSSLTVISRQGGRTAGRRWTLDSIKENWSLETVAAGHAKSFYDTGWKGVRNSRTGVLVVWDDLELRLPTGDPFEISLNEMIRELANDLGLRFHRFLARKQLAIRLQVAWVGEDEPQSPALAVVPLDPFGYPASGHRGFPITFKVEGGAKASNVALRAHIWPAGSKSPNYRLGGGKVAGRQGFYFYRNNRLIQAGGWHGLRNDNEPHSSLARVEIDLQPELDKVFKLTIQKSAFKPPQAFLTKIADAMTGGTSFKHYLELAQEVYRREGAAAKPVVGVLGKGLPISARQSSKKQARSSGGEGERIDFEWDVLPAGQVFNIDRDRLRIVLNSSFRSIITGGKNTSTDAPLFKALLMLSVEAGVLAKRQSEPLKAHLERVNSLLLSIVKSR